jgi:hypothetical protein
MPQGAGTSEQAMRVLVTEDDEVLATALAPGCAVTVKTTIRRLRANLGDPPVTQIVRNSGCRIGEP